MHEYSIVQALLEQCEDHVKANDASKVTKVIIKIGVMSGVEPDLLKRAFETFKAGTVCDKAELDLQIQDLEVYCYACQESFVLEAGSYECPRCKSVEVNVTDGKEMMLMQLQMQ